MKAPWFPFYTGDFLASPDVQLMEAAAVGAYVLLLTFSWQSDMPGYIEDDDYTMRRTARLSASEWEAFKKVLLKKWPAAEDMPGYRVNPRLLKEAGKQVELREKKAEAGRLSAERRAQQAAERQQSGNTIPTGVDQNPTGVAIPGNYSQPQPQPQAKAGGEGATPAEPSPLKAEKAKKAEVVAAHTDPDDLQDVAHSPLCKPESFAAILRATGYPDLDVERYQSQIAAKSEGVKRTASQWRSRIIEFVNNDYTAGKLLTYPKQTPNEVPSNWPEQKPYTAPQGMGIPNMNSVLKPEFQIK